MDRAFATGTILRTHVLRPTWHFVLLQTFDGCWNSPHCGYRPSPRPSTAIKSSMHNFSSAAPRSSSMLSAMDGILKMRRDIAGELEQSGIPTNPPRLGAVMMNAELQGIVCSGVPRGKQQTYALLEEAAPRARRRAAKGSTCRADLPVLCRPWTCNREGSPVVVEPVMTDIQQGLELVGSRMERAVIDGSTYWFVPPAAGAATPSPRVHLVQGYDEYIVGYGDKDFCSTCRVLPDRCRGVASTRTPSSSTVKLPANGSLCRRSDQYIWEVILLRRS